MSMNNLGIVKRNIERAEPAAVEKLSRFGSATVHEAMGRVGLMQPYMRPIYPGAHVCGTAVTVLLHPGDNWMLHVVAEQIQPGDIVVVAGKGHEDYQLVQDRVLHLDDREIIRDWLAGEADHD